MSERLPINHDVLRWARETANYSVDDVVIKLKKKSVDAEAVEQWESGIGSPTYSQLETLAYDIYRRPLAVFFLPEPPVEEIGARSFRSLSNSEYAEIPPAVRFLLRKAKSFQLGLYDVFDGVNPAEKSLITNQVELTPQSNIVKAAKQVRELLSVTLEIQVEQDSVDSAFKLWRETMNSAGVFVFKDAFKQDDYSGFCLYDDLFPLIYINNSQVTGRQIFSLFHELAHLLLRTDGIDREGSFSHSKIETFCDSFAGEFLVPDAVFLEQVDQEVDAEDCIALAEYFNVSREVTLRKALNHKKISYNKYASIMKAWRKGTDKKGTGGSYYNNQGVYLDRVFAERAFSKYYQDKFSIDQLADYLNVKVQSIPGIEHRMLNNGVAA